MGGTDENDIAAKKPSHISVNSVSELPTDIRMVNCEVICKESVEALVQENQEEDSQNNNQVEEEQQQESEENNNNEPLSLEQMEANGQHLNDADEEIVEEEEEEEEVETKKSADQAFFSGQVFTPEDVEEVEREELPEVNHEGEVGEAVIEAVVEE